MRYESVARLVDLGLIAADWAGGVVDVCGVTRQAFRQRGDECQEGAFEFGTLVACEVVSAILAVGVPGVNGVERTQDRGGVGERQRRAVDASRRPDQLADVGGRGCVELDCVGDSACDGVAFGVDGELLRPRRHREVVLFAVCALAVSFACSGIVGREVADFVGVFVGADSASRTFEVVVCCHVVRQLRGSPTRPWEVGGVVLWRPAAEDHVEAGVEPGGFVRVFRADRP